MRATSYVFILLTILFTVYGQLIIKWQAGQAGGIPHDLGDKLFFFAKFLMNPWVISAFAAAFLASLAWIGAVSKLPLSHAYPFMSFAFVLVLILSSLLFHEPLTWQKVVGMVCIVSGIVIGSQG